MLPITYKRKSRTGKYDRFYTFSLLYYSKIIMYKYELLASNLFLKNSHKRKISCHECKLRQIKWKLYEKFGMHAPL